jgi:hypothetical protein
MMQKPGLLAVLATSLAFICVGMSPLGALADGTQTLGPPGITVATGTGILAAGTGMVSQPGTIELDIPSGAEVNQVLLYWSGYSLIPNPGDATIEVNGNVVSGTLMGGPQVNDPGTHNDYAYRADITGLGLVSDGLTSLTVEGLEFVGGVAEGAGVLVVYDDGSGLSDTAIRDGIDGAFEPRPPPLDATVPQTFSFNSADIDRTATLAMFFSSVSGTLSGGGFRPSAIEVTTGGFTDVLDNLLDSADGEEWDSVLIPVVIPAGETSLTVEALSVDNLGIGGEPASLNWIAAGLAVPSGADLCAGVDPESECCDPATGEITPIDDGVDCTVDECDPSTGIVTHTPDDGSCDDGVFCNGAEICDPTLGCQPGADPCEPPLLCDEEAQACVGCETQADCDDANDCTDDICNQDLGACENTCNATGSEDPCCSDPACSSDPVCEQIPECGNGIVDPGEICGEPGLDECPEAAPICLDCVDCGIPVELLNFRAIDGESNVMLTWETATEIDTAGFYLVRSESPDGEFERINEELIPAQGGPTQGGTYSYIDNTTLIGVTYWYRLVDVDVTGESYFHDPVVSVTLADAGWAAAPSADASVTGRALDAGSGLFNSIAFFIVPLGAILILRRLRR